MKNVMKRVFLTFVISNGWLVDRVYRKLWYKIIGSTEKCFLYKYSIKYNLYYCRRNVTGSVKRTRTGLPDCLPGFHLGMLLTTRSASRSR